MNNTILRTISGTGFIAVMLAGLLINKFLFAALVMFLMATMMHEFFTITMNDRYRFSRLLSILAGLILFSLIFCVSAYGLEVKYVSIAILPIMIVMVNSLYVKDKTEFGKFSDIYTGFLYIAVPLSLSNLIVFFPNPATSSNEFNGIILLCFFILIWSSDIGGYVFGSTLGKSTGNLLEENLAVTCVNCSRSMLILFSRLRKECKQEFSGMIPIIGNLAAGRPEISMNIEKIHVDGNLDAFALEIFFLEGFLDYDDLSICTGGDKPLPFRSMPYRNTMEPSYENTE